MRVGPFLFSPLLQIVNAPQTIEKEVEETNSILSHANAPGMLANLLHCNAGRSSIEEPRSPVLSPEGRTITIQIKIEHNAEVVTTIENTALDNALAVHTSMSLFRERREWKDGSWRERRLVPSSSGCYRWRQSRHHGVEERLLQPSEVQYRRLSR